LKKLSKSNRAVTLMLSEKNGGKGKALIEGFKLVNGDFTVIQDADLEYDPEDYVKLLEPILKGNADVVFGSRFSGQHKAFLFMNYVANKILNLITNILYNTILTDMETCYKMFKTPVIKDLSLVSRGFEIESEITAKILKNKLRIYEVPINYNGRSYKDGKKIKASDGFKALFALIRYRF
jgi:glycosyltransferase involved in cell wall biosynthesis